MICIHCQDISYYLIINKTFLQLWCIGFGVSAHKTRGNAERIFAPTNPCWPACGRTTQKGTESISFRISLPSSPSLSLPPHSLVSILQYLGWGEGGGEGTSVIVGAAVRSLLRPAPLSAPENVVDCNLRFTGVILQKNHVNWTSHLWLYTLKKPRASPHFFPCPRSRVCWSSWRARNAMVQGS